MSTIHTVETQIDLDFGCYIDECIETLRDKDYIVFTDEEEARFYFGENDLIAKIKEIVAEMRENVIYAPNKTSQDYKDVYEKLDRVLFYE